MINPFCLNTHKKRLLDDAMLNFKFIASTHTYTSNKKPSYISITRLLKEMGITPNYDSVDKKTLEDAVMYGNMIHKEIENYCKYDETGMTTELNDFIKWCKSNKVNFIASEYMVHDTDFAGTIDLILKINGEIVIADVKTTSEIHKDAVSWQLSLYRYLLKEHIHKGLCIHIRPNSYEVVEIPLKDDTECERLIEAYKNQTNYSVAILEDKQVSKLFELQEALKQMDQEKKRIEKQIQDFKDKCLYEMKERNLLSVELNADDKKLKITRVIPKEKESINYEKLIKDNPQIDIDQYKTYTPIKEYIKISG